VALTGCDVECRVPHATATANAMNGTSRRMAEDTGERALR